MVNEAGAASEGGWGPRQEGQWAGGRGMGGCGGRKCRSVLNRDGEEEMKARTGFITLWLQIRVQKTVSRLYAKLS